MSCYGLAERTKQNIERKVRELMDKASFSIVTKLDYIYT